jgi:hypothetical protein
MSTLKTQKEVVDNIKMDYREVGCEDERWMELDQDCVQWQALVLVVTNPPVLLPWC